MYFHKKIELILNKIHTRFCFHIILYYLPSIVLLSIPSPDETRFLPTSQHGLTIKYTDNYCAEHVFVWGRVFVSQVSFFIRGIQGSSVLCFLLRTLNPTAIKQVERGSGSQQHALNWSLEHKNKSLR